MPEPMEGDKDEELADWIGEYRDFDWAEIKKDMPKMSTEELVDLMVELELYVNKTIALEIAKREDAVFWLRRLIQNRELWLPEKGGDAFAPIQAIRILALIKTNEALELLLDSLRYLNEDLGDILTEEPTALLFAFGEGVIGKLKEFSADETLEPFTRGTSVTALVLLAKKFPSRANEVKEHLVKLLNTTKDRTAASLIADDLATFHDPSLLREIERAFKEGRMDDFTRWNDIEDAFNDVGGTLEEFFLKEPLYFFSSGNIKNLHALCYPSRKKKTAKKAGRNEPCPCGSGKKYKKCCIGNSVAYGVGS